MRTCYVGARARAGLGWLRRKRGALTLAMATVALSPLLADTIVVRDVAVTTEPVAGGSSSSHGYCEYRFLVTNRSSENTREVVIQLGGGFGSGSSLGSLTRTVKVAPGATAKVSLFQPAIPLSGTGVRVTVGGTTKSGSVSMVGSHGVQPYYLGHMGGQDIADLLISRGLNADSFSKRVDKMFEDASSSGTPYGGVSIPPGKTGAYRLFRAEKDVRQWTDNWLGFSRFDCVVLSGQDVVEMRRETSEALRRYVLAGGSVVVMGGSFAPGGASDPEPWMSSDIQHAYLGFGEIINVPGPDWSALKDDQYRGLMKVWMKSREPWKRPKSLIEAHRAFPVTDRLHVPTRGFFLIMLIYSALIGPVAIGVLNKLNRRAWLLWIVPSASLLTCLLVALYSILSEGIRATVRLGGLTLLDEARHEATTIGWAGFYSPLTPSKGLRFADDTELTAMLPHSWSSPDMKRVIDWTQGQHLAAGWLRARVPAYFMVRRHGTQRERLECRPVEGGLEVMNGFGCRIQKLELVDEGGHMFATGNLPAGEKRVLTPVEGSKVAFRSGTLRAAFAREWSGLEEFVGLRGREFLAPGMYLATLEGAPFMDRGLSGNLRDKLESRVVGIMDSSAAGEGES